MFNLKEKINKFNILITITALLSLIVIGQSIYIATLYAKESNIPNTIIRPNQSTALNSKIPIDSSISKPRNLFDDFDNKFMSNHFKEFRKIKEHMDKVFNDAFSEFNIRPGFDDDFANIFGHSKFSNNLNMDLQNDPDKFIVTLKIPNSKEKNLDIKLNGQRLTIAGDIKEQIEESNDSGKQYREYSSNFTRSILLPEKVIENSLTSKFAQDKLIITILKEGTV